MEETQIAKIQTNVVFDHLCDTKKRFVVEQGGTRCLAGSTLVATPNGNIEISSLNVGDKVLTPIGERNIINRFVYDGADLAQSLLLFNYNGKEITCTREHRFLTQDGYVKAIDLAKRAMEDGAWVEWTLLHKFIGETSDNESSRTSGTQREGSDNETSEGREWLSADGLGFTWEVDYHKTASGYRDTFYRKSTREAGSESQRRGQIQQFCSKFGVGDSRRESETRYGERAGSGYYGVEEWYESIDGRGCGRNKVSVYPLRGDGEGFGKGIWGERSLYQGHTRRANVESCYFDPRLVYSVADGGRESVYDIEVEGASCYILSDTGIVSHNSGKTYNIIIWILFHYCYNNKGKVISVVRKTSPSLKGTVMRDFLEILGNAGLYSEKNHNKTQNEYKFEGNLIEFIAVDDPQKIRGRKRDLCFCNEANELTYEDFRQLNFRTNDLFILDYNPSDEFHWIYDFIIPKLNEDGESDCDFFQTTYLDNPFLSKELVKQIEALQGEDDAMWQIYGMGNRASLKDLVFDNWKIVDIIPPQAKFSGYGLDFGYTADPTAMVGVWEMDNELYVRQIIYETALTNHDICDKLISLDTNRSDIIYADSAEPKSIEEIGRRGFNIFPCPKGADSVRNGIDLLKTKKMNIVAESVELIKELKMYKWGIDKDGKNTGKPIDRWNHGIDALRYWALTNIKRRNYGKYKFR